MNRFMLSIFLYIATSGLSFAATAYRLVTFEELPDCSTANLNTREIAALKLNGAYVSKPTPTGSASMYSICKILTLENQNKIAISASYDTDMSGNDSTLVDSVFNLDLLRPVQKSSANSKFVEFSGDLANGYLRSAFLQDSDGRSIGGIFLANLQLNIGSKQINSIYFRPIQIGATGIISIGHKIPPASPVEESHMDSPNTTRGRQFECMAFTIGAKQILHAANLRCKG